jgi:hypothetical protein
MLVSKGELLHPVLLSAYLIFKAFKISDFDGKKGKNWIPE